MLYNNLEYSKMSYYNLEYSKMFYRYNNLEYSQKSYNLEYSKIQDVVQHFGVFQDVVQQLGLFQEVLQLQQLRIFQDDLQVQTLVIFQDVVQQLERNTFVGPYRGQATSLHSVFALCAGNCFQAPSRPYRRETVSLQSV